MIAETDGHPLLGLVPVPVTAAVAARLGRPLGPIMTVRTVVLPVRAVQPLRAILPPECIVRLDARQSNPDRYRAFLRCLSDRPLAIVGNRSPP